MVDISTIPYKTVNRRDYIWSTPKKICTYKKNAECCHRCKTKLQNGFSIIPIDYNKGIKVDGYECIKCKILY